MNFVNTSYPICQLQDTHIYGDIIKNPQLSQIILIVVWFTSPKGSQMYEDIFITYESKPA